MGLTEKRRERPGDNREGAERAFVGGSPAIFPTPASSNIDFNVDNVTTVLLTTSQTIASRSYNSIQPRIQDNRRDDFLRGRQLERRTEAASVVKQQAGTADSFTKATRRDDTCGPAEDGRKGQSNEGVVSGYNEIAMCIKCTAWVAYGEQTWCRKVTLLRNTQT